MPITDLESTMSLGRIKPGKEDPSPPCREGQGIRWHYQTFKAVCPTIFLEWLEDSWLSSIRPPYLKQWKGQPLGKFLVWADDHHQDVHMHCHGYAPKDCNGANPNGWAPIVEYGIQYGTWKQKHIPEQTPTHISKLMAGSTLKEKLTCKGPMVWLAYGWGGIWGQK